MNGWKEKMQNKVSSLTEKEIEEFLNTIDVIDEEGSDDVVSTDDEDIDDGINLVDKFSFGCGELGISVSDLNLTLVTPTASVAREESSVNLHGDSTPPAPPKRPKTCAGVSSYIFRRFDGNVVQMRQKDEEISKIVWKKKSMKVHEDQIKFQCPDMSGFVQLTTPYKCFCYFADEHFFFYYCK